MTTTIHFIDAFDHRPVAEVSRLENQLFEHRIELSGPEVPAWAQGREVRPYELAANAIWSLADRNLAPRADRDWHIYITLDYTHTVRQYIYEGENTQILDILSRQSPLRLHCHGCGGTWTVGEEPASRRQSERPLYRECCANFACSNCHVADIETWYCYSCDTDHCTGIRLRICEDCAVDSCIVDHCGSGEDFEFEESSASMNYRTRSVNTSIRLRGSTHEKARGGRYIGVEIEAEGGEGYDLTNAMPHGVGVTGDGSLDCGVEIQTPPARGSALVEVIEQSTTALKEAGWDVSHRCGLHVHIDMGDKQDDGVFLGRLYAAFYAIEPLLFQLQGGRRDNNSYCIPLKDVYMGGGSRMQRKSAKKIMADWHGVRKYRSETDREFDQRLEAYMRDKYHQSRYRATNFHSIGCHGTLEIRLHEGTLDSDEILAWADLIQSIVRGCEDDRWPGGQRLRYASNPVKAQRMFHFTRKTREYLVNRLNREATNLSGKRYAVTAGSIVEVKGSN